MKCCWQFNSDILYCPDHSNPPWGKGMAIGVYHVNVTIDGQDGSDRNARKAVITVAVTAKDLNSAIDKAVGMLNLNREDVPIETINQ